MTHFQYNHPVLPHQHAIHMQLSYTMGVLSDIGRLCQLACDGASDTLVHADGIRVFLSNIANQLHNVHISLDEVRAELINVSEHISKMHEQIDAFAKLINEPLYEQNPMTFGNLLVTVLLSSDYTDFVRNLAWDILDNPTTVILPHYQGSMSMYLQAFLIFRDRPIQPGLSKTFGDLILQMADLNAKQRRKAFIKWADDILESLYTLNLTDAH